MSTNPIIILINALLTQKRILFLGHQKPSGEVANFVLAACALGSCGILRGYTERCFPYTNLAGLDDLLKVYVYYLKNNYHYYIVIFYNTININI